MERSIFTLTHIPFFKYNYKDSMTLACSSQKTLKIVGFQQTIPMVSSAPLKKIMIPYAETTTKKEL